MHFIHASKNAIAVTLLLILCIGAAPASFSKAAPEKSPAIWKISDHDSVIWLFGTIHILNPKLKWRSTQIDTAFSSAEKIYFEAPANSKGMQALIMRHGIDKHRPLSSKMSASGKIQMVKALKTLGLPASRVQQFEPMRPWLVGLTLAAAQIVAQGGDPSAGVEKTLSHEAAKQGKAIGYFETDEEQIMFLSGLSEPAEIFFLEDGLRAINEEPMLLDELTKSWATGDVRGIDAAMVHSLQGHQE
ncbi:MAG: TraB/GumN family protein, partial [Kordiimonadaceae bacterium]|nr:TraB/GumN family protein [Kordiimonadaceae bacterium]